MERKFKITVDGRQYDVTVEDLSDLNSGSEPIVAIMPPAFTHSFAPGVAAPAAAPARPKAVRAAAEAGEVACPLNGVVESAPVAVGQEVSEGDCVLVVEAMKMKTPVTTPWSGKVTAVLVKAGDGVEAGQIVVTVG